MTDDQEAITSTPDRFASYTSPVDVVLDRIQLGLLVIFPTLGTSDATAFRSELVTVGLLPRPPRRGAALRGSLQLGPTEVPLPHGGSATIRGRIALREEESGHLAITGQSTLLLNLLRALRSQLPEPGALGTDGADNVVGPYPDGYAYYLAVQLETVACIVNQVVTALADAAETEPGLLRGNVWVQQCEVTRDYEVHDAEDFVRDLSRLPIPGAGWTQTRTWREPGRSGLSYTWHEGSDTSPRRKVYAKRPDLVRTEIALRNREAVRVLLRRAGEATEMPGLSGAEIAASLSSVACAAAPLLDTVRSLVNEVVDVPPRVGLDYLLAMAALLRLAVPPPRARGAAGRPPDPSVAVLARQALDELLAAGAFDARRLGASNAVLTTLREMRAAGSVRTDPARPRIFSIHPSLEAARRALSGVRQRPAEPDPAPSDGDGASAGAAVPRGQTTPQQKATAPD